MSQAEPIFVGVHGSTQKTVALVGHRARRSTSNGKTYRILGRGEAEPIRPSGDASIPAAANIRRAIDVALANAGLPTSLELGLGQLVLGIPDRGRSSGTAQLAPLLSESLLVPLERVRVVASVELILPAAEVAVGVALEVGARSSALAVAGDGKTALVGGSTSQIGDDGSAFAVGREALRAVLRADGGIGPATLLTSALAGALGAHEPRDLIRAVYPAPSSRTTIAALAPVVLATARAGDPTASEILTRTGRELGKLARAAARRLELGSETVVVIASSFEAGDLILAPLRVELARVEITDLRELVAEPVVGALHLATSETAPRLLSVVT